MLVTVYLPDDFHLSSELASGGRAIARNWSHKCHLTFCSNKEEEITNQSRPIDLPPDDIDMIDNEDVCMVKVVKPEEAKRKRK